MDYNKHYSALIERAKNRHLDEYTEAHHVVPRCMGGSNNKSNIVRLRAEEHYIAHLLLVKMHPFHSGLLYAANMMANRNNKSYSWARKKFAKMHSARLTGRKMSPEQAEKVSKRFKGVSKSEDHKNKIALAHTQILEYKGNYYHGWSDLKANTKISRHNYLKYYKNGIDPTPFINNNMQYRNLKQ